MIAKRLPYASVVAASIVVLAIGCGGSGDSGEPVLTKHQFVARASGICHRAESEEVQLIDSFSKSHPDAKNEEELVDPAFIPPAEKMVRDLAGLRAPAGDESAVEAMVEALEAGLTETKQEPKALLSPDTNPFKKADALARDYGVKACSYVP